MCLEVVLGPPIRKFVQAGHLAQFRRFTILIIHNGQDCFAD